MGVLIDDLVTKGTNEPYRMFTSRAEYRLLLRADNADLRLTPKGLAIGCVDGAREKVFTERLAAIGQCLTLARATKVRPSDPLGQWVAQAAGAMPATMSVFDVMKRPQVSTADVLRYVPELGQFGAGALEQLEVEAKYDGYLQRQQSDADRMRADEALEIPTSIDYDTLPGLSTEVRQKLKAHTPATLGAAGRVSGVTPAALQSLWLWVQKEGRAGA